MNKTLFAKNFNNYFDTELDVVPKGPAFTKVKKKISIEERDLSYRFYNHFHPYVSKLIQRLQAGSINGLQAADTQSIVDSQGNKISEFYKDFFKTTYSPTENLETEATSGVTVLEPYPSFDLDFETEGAYAAYNWELFFHVPFTIAVYLSKNQHFAEAQRWFHYLFDPTDDSDDPVPARYWKVKPFQKTDIKKVEEILLNLSLNADPELRTKTIKSIEAWKDAPFRPHLIAAYRPQAYMYKIVMAYLDNLIAWGDALFRQDTGESIDEALMLYILAANILGPRGQRIPRKGTIRKQTYANLRKEMNEFGNVLRDMEVEVPFVLEVLPKENNNPKNERLATISSLGKSPYFCVPPNEKWLGYWDTMADRLFKIRNSLNFQGIFRQLALFEPPIDPAILAKAAASGQSLADITSGLNKPLPLIRFQFLIQKASELCQEVKALGSQLLSLMEKEDGETLALLRSKHERTVLSMVEQVKYGQWQETIKTREGLFKSLGLAAQRYRFYERQLGKKPAEIVIPELEELSKDDLENMKLVLNEPDIHLREIKIDIAKNEDNQGDGRILNSYEAEELSLLETGQKYSQLANGFNALSTVAYNVPAFQAVAAFLGLGASAEYGGKNVGDAFTGLATASRALAEWYNFDAGKASRMNTFVRREMDWSFQSNLAAGEISQIYKQLRATQIREAIAELELKSHRQQMKQAEELERFLNEEGNEREGKKTNKSLYAWMKREIKGLYGQCFQFVFDAAKKAERALQHELGDTTLNYLTTGYFTGQEGLLAGEKLYFDIKRLEMAYIEFKQREYELTKHISLLQLDSLALIQLRKTGKCEVTLPEEIFDIEGAGQYFRRIKSVAVSIPCIVGPYMSINCKLTLLESQIRKSDSLLENDIYTKQSEDKRFDINYASLMPIVSSSAQNDTGLFETNLHDERYLPFEGHGVISKWRLELPANPSLGESCNFDYNTISDLILHIRYTAKEGGDKLAQAAKAHLNEWVKKTTDAIPLRLFSIRHEFPSIWYKLLTQAANLENHQSCDFELTLQKEHYPFWCQARLKEITEAKLLVYCNPQSALENLNIYKEASLVSDATTVKLSKATYGDILMGDLTFSLPKEPLGTFKFFLDSSEAKYITDMWLAIRYHC